MTITNTVSLNINSQIRVRLTPTGQVALERHYFPLCQELKKPMAELLPKADAEGWHSFELWDFMSIFGPSLHMGMPNPIIYNNDIEVLL